MPASQIRVHFRRSRPASFPSPALVIVGAVTGGAGDVAILDVAGEEVAFEGATEAEASVEAGDSAPEAEQDVAKNEDSQSCPTNSFAPHTLVLLANGQLIAIDKVKVGDAVEAFDTKTGKRRAERVTKVWINHDTDLLDLTFSVHGHSYELDTTQHHPFWDARTHSWVEAENLKQGTILATNTRATSQVTRSKVMTTTALMWDLTVALDHDFYVSVRSASTAVLVHNCPDNRDSEFRQPQRKINAYGKTEVPSCVLAKGYVPYVGETPVEAATRVMEEETGALNFPRGPKTPFNQIIKYFSRAFH